MAHLASAKARSSAALSSTTESTAYPSRAVSTYSKYSLEKPEAGDQDFDFNFDTRRRVVTDSLQWDIPGIKDEAVLDEKKVPVEEADAETPNEEEPEYPSKLRLTFITVALCLSVLCVALDNTIIATAIPRITDQFHALNDVGWYGSAYLLTTCAFQLLYGKIYTFFNIKWVYLCALFIFELGSLVCGVAPTSKALIVGRAVAGLGAGGVFSGAIIILAHTVPLAKRPIFMGAIGSMYGIASVAGPLMGGAFTDHLTWRWCFYINLPLGAVTMVFVVLFFQPPKGASGRRQDIGWKARLNQLDILGTAIFVPAVVCLLLALQWGGSQYPWKDGRIIALFVVFGVLIIAFVGIQFWKQDNATVPPRILKQRSMAAAAWFSICVGGAFFAIIFYVPIWFQAIQGVSATESGIRNLGMLLAVVVTSLLGGAGTSIIGYYTPFVYASTILSAVGAGLISTWQTDTGIGKWIGYQVIFGAGIGFGLQMPLTAVQTVLPIKDIPVGTAMAMFSQTLGGALMISVAQNVFTNKLIQNLMATVPDLNPAVVISTGATQLKNVINAASLGAVLEAYNGALTTTFYVSVAMAVLGVFGAAGLEWKSVKGKKIEMAGGA